MIVQKVAHAISVFFEKYCSAFIAAFLLVLPNLVWIILDHGLWRGDPVGYALNAMRLYSDLGSDFSAWKMNMFNGYKGPGIYWFGQLMLPLGELIGSINFALLLIPTTAVFLSLYFLFKSFKFFFQSKGIALCGCLIVISSPLFNGLATGFWIEPMQVAIVSWFIYATCKVKEWDWYLVVAQFVVAFSLSILIKASTPLYILGPIILIVLSIITRVKLFQVNRKQVGILVLSLLIAIPTVVFYGHNFSAIIRFARFASTSPLFSSETPRITLWNENVYSLVFQESALMVPYLIFLGGIIGLIRHKNKNRFLFIFSLSLVQIAFFFVAWINSSNADSRYFAPAIPYFSALVCWGLAIINKKSVTAIAVAVFFVQFVFITGYSFGLIRSSPSQWAYRPVAITLDKDIVVLQHIAPFVTRDSAVIFDLNPELGVAEFQFELAKKNLKSNWQKSCIDISMFFNYQHQEIDTQAINIDTVYTQVLNYHPDYYITWRSRLFTSAISKEMQRIDKYNAVTAPARWALAERIKASKDFVLVDFPSNPDLLVYKYRAIRR